MHAHLSDRRARLLASAAVLTLVAGACGQSTSKSGVAHPPAAQVPPPTVSTVAPIAPSGAAPITPAAVAAGTPWPSALHDGTHSSASSATGPTTGATTWTRALGAPINAGAVLSANGTIYDSADNGILHAIDPATGKDLWTFDGGGSTDNGEDLSTSAAVQPDGTIVWPGPHSTLFALDPEGRLLWQQKLAGIVLSPALGTGGKLYVADSVGDVAAFHASAAGAGRLWQINVGTTSFSFGSPAVGPDGTIYTTAGRDLIAITDDETNAVVKWRFVAGGQIEVAASVARDGNIVLGTNDSYEYGITPQGTVAWKYPRRVYSYSTPAVTADGLAYFGDNDGYVDVVSAADGTVVGRYNGTSRALTSNGIGVWTAPLVDARHDVYFGTASGHVIGFNYDGKKLFDIATGAIVASYPAMTANGTLLIGSDNGTLYAFHG